MEGVSIDVDEALLVDAPGGRIDLDNTRYQSATRKAMAARSRSALI